MITNTISQEFEKLINHEDIMEFAVHSLPYRHSVFLGQSLDGRPTNTPFRIEIYSAFNNGIVDHPNAYSVSLWYDDGKTSFKGIGVYDAETNHFELDHETMFESINAIDVDIRSAIMFKLLAVNNDK